MDEMLIQVAQRHEPCSFLLRLWHASDGGWRASLQSVQTGERHMFASIESLCAFLTALMD